MNVLLQQHKKYENPPLPVFRGKSATHDDIKDEDEDGSNSDDLYLCLADGTPEDTVVMNTDFPAQGAVVLYVIIYKNILMH